MKVTFPVENQLRRWFKQHQKASQILLVVALLLVCTLVLSACNSYPSQDAPCTGANRNAAGCQNPAPGIKDDPIGGEWYIDWSLKILRTLLSSLAIAAVQLGVNIFWAIYTNLASTDFLACTGGGTNPTCAASGVFETVRNIAFVLFPVVLSWRFFKSYFIGALVEAVYESGFSSAAKMLMGGMVLAFLDTLITVAFGLSNTLFIAISGGGETLSELGSQVVGSGKGSGVGSVTEVVNLGLLMFITAICLLTGAVFILLGIVFFLRTILIFILFALSPLAVVAGLTDEFRAWFYRWLQSIQAMLVAPIPVAICLALVKSFVSTIPSAHDSPAEFLLQMVYVIAFLSIGAILMFKIAGQVGGLAYGLATTAAGFAVGAGAGTLGSAFNRQAIGGKGEVGHTQIAGEANQTREGEIAISGNQLKSGLEGGTLTGEFPGLGTGEFSGVQQQGNLVNAIRGLQESLNVNVVSSNIPGPGGNPSSFNFGAARGAQNLLNWAGQEAGVSSPYISFTPSGNPGKALPLTENKNFSYRRIELEAIGATGNGGYYPGQGPQESGNPYGPSGPTGANGPSDPTNYGNNPIIIEENFSQKNSQTYPFNQSQSRPLGLIPGISSVSLPEGDNSFQNNSSTGLISESLAERESLAGNSPNWVLPEGDGSRVPEEQFQKAGGLTGVASAGVAGGWLETEGAIPDPYGGRPPFLLPGPSGNIEPESEA